MPPDRQIALLAALLPQQRRRLLQQSQVLLQAVKHKATSPTGLVVAVLAGAALGGCCFRQERGHKGAPVVAGMRWYVTMRAFVMAYLVRSLA